MLVFETQTFKLCEKDLFGRWPEQSGEKCLVQDTFTQPAQTPQLERQQSRGNGCRAGEAAGTAHDSVAVNQAGQRR